MHKIINYSEKYFSQIVSLWNEVLTFDKITGDKLHRDMVDSKLFNGKFIKLVVNDENVIGFIWSAIENEKGYIVAIAVKEKYQNLGYGKELINEVEKEFKARSIKEIIVGPLSPVYIFPGIDKKAYPKAEPLFISNGYSIGAEVHSMIKEALHSKEIKSKAMFERMNKNNVNAIIEFLKSEFPGWETNILLLASEHNFKQPVIASYLDNKIIGVAQSGFNGDINRFGPIGVKEEFRDLGIGQHLFEAMENEMVKEGFKYFYFLQAAERVKNFYLRNGMKIKRTYLLCSKKFN